MKKENFENLITAIKAVVPDGCEVSILSIRRPLPYLVVIKIPEKEIDIDDWAVDEIHSLHWDKVQPLFLPPGHYRPIYCLGNKFVLYAIKQGGLWSKFKHPLQCDAYGNFEHHKYVGECQDIDEIINYLTSLSWF